MNEKTKKIIFIILLVIFLPSAIYLLAVRAFLMFFVMAAIVSIIITGIKRLESNQN